VTKLGDALGDALQPRLTVDGIRTMLEDLRRAGKRMPSGILVSEYDRRELNQDLFGASVEPVAKADQRPEHDGEAIGVIGVPVTSHPDVRRGTCRLIYPAAAPTAKPLPSGKIISLPVA
jgi:3-hydroxy-3-methylglutaryl CoA synthase